MKVIYNTCFIDPWLKVAKELKEKYGFEPVYWIGYEIDNSESLVPAAFPNAIYHPIFDAWKGIFPDPISNHYGESHVNIDFLKANASYELQAIKMMDRMDADSHSFSFSERQRHYRNFIRNWTSCLQFLKPDLVISAAVPHRVYDYVLYLLCRHFHIPFVMFLHTAFPGRIIPLRDIYDIGKEIKDDYNDIVSSNQDYKLLKTKLAPDILERYQTVLKDYKQGKPAYMETNDSLHKQSSNVIGLSIKLLNETIHRPGKYFGRKGYLLQGFPTYVKQRKKSIEASRLSIIQYSINKIKTNKHKRKLKNYYDSRTEKPDFIEPYIYLPLHYQPEMTSSPAGDIFVDQFLCVETLVKNTPDNWKIYVKEHPLQFQAHSEGQTGRIKEFYDDLLQIPNIRLMPLQADSFNLISNAKAVATITGTVGWEAMVRRKPVLLFGLSWYEKYPGALKIADEESAGKIYDFIENFLFDENKLLAYLAALEKNSKRDYCLTKPKETVNQSEEEYVGNLLVLIMRSLNK